MKTPNPAPVMHEQLASAAYDCGDATWLRFIHGGSHSYREVYEDTLAVASWLRARGIREGDRVLIFIGNRYEFVVALMGISAAGAIAVPMHVDLRGDVLDHMIQVADPVAAILESSVHLEAVARAPGMRVAAVIDRDDATSGRVAINLEPFALDALRRQAGDFTPSPIDERASSMILFTSGTTGRSKGVHLSHLAVYHLCANTVVANMQYTAEDTLYTCLPLFHGNAMLTSMFPALLCRSTVAVGSRFSVSHFWSEICESSATATNLLGAMTMMLFKREPYESERSHSLRTALVIPCSPETRQQVRTRFGVEPIEAYGLTDFGMLLWQPPNEIAPPGSCGRPTMGYELAIVDADDNPLPPGEIGELVARTTKPWIASDRYWGDPNASLQARRNFWFHTGDLMRCDEHGWYYFVDRVKDAIRRRGENVSAFEVEQAVLTHPNVAECAAYPLPSDFVEDEVAVAIVCAPGATMAPIELIQYLESRLPYFAVPRYVTFVDCLPKTATAKIKKQDLRSLGVTASTWDREAAGYTVRR